MINTNLSRAVQKEDIDSFKAIFNEKLSLFKRTTSNGKDFIICPHCGKIEHLYTNRETNESKVQPTIHIGALIYIDILDVFGYIVSCSECGMQYYAVVCDDTLKFIPITTMDSELTSNISSLNTNSINCVNTLEKYVYKLIPEYDGSDKYIAVKRDEFDMLCNLSAYIDTSHEIHSYLKNKQDVLETFMNPNT